MELESKKKNLWFRVWEICEVMIIYKSDLKIIVVIEYIKIDNYVEIM